MIEFNDTSEQLREFHCVCGRRIPDMHLCADCQRRENRMFFVVVTVLGIAGILVWLRS